MNFVGYRFRGSIPTDRNWYIAKVDLNLNRSGTQTLFWRGALADDVQSSPPYLPGTAPLSSNSDHSKGFSLGYTALIKPTLINNFHWGYTRQSLGFGGNNDSQPFNYFRGLNDNEGAFQSELAVTRSDNYQTPVHNFTDDLSWTKGKHTIQFGANLRFIRNPRQNFLSSFSSGSTNPSGLNTGGIVGSASPLNPGNYNGSSNYPALGYPDVSDAVPPGL